MLGKSSIFHLLHSEMARVSPKLIKDAYRRSPLLPYYLRANRNLEAAYQELKWVQNELPREKWLQASRLRNNLYPLQYILGTQPFGELEIRCRKDVLIPRPETEEWVLKMCNILKDHTKTNLLIVDACTGSGCIALLTKYELGSTTRVSAFDISDHAIELASENRDVNSIDIDIFKADLKTPITLKNNLVDLVLSNPPYIPLRDYKQPVLLNGVEKSVRKFEPRLALVGENEFYEYLVRNLVVPNGAQGFIFELGYIEQAIFVKDELSKDWECGVFFDYSGNIRCCIGWKRGSNFSFLREMCNELI